MRLVANGPGLGDAVVLTAVVRALNERDPSEPVAVSSGWPDVFKGHPNVSATEPWDAGARSFPELDAHRGPEHQLNVMFRKLGLPELPAEEIRPHVACDGNGDLRLGSLPPSPFVTISTTPGPWTRNKDWTLPRWRTLVRALINANMAVVQIGGPDDVPLDECSRHIMGEPIEVVAAVLRAAKLHVAPVTGTMHLATGVGTKVVAIFGGREDPGVTGYACNRNLTWHPEQGCAPCWLVEPCPYLIEGDVWRPCIVPFGDVLSSVFEEIVR